MNEAEFYKLIEANQTCSGFDFSFWGRHDVCGTVGCLAGNYAIKYNLGLWTNNSKFFNIKMTEIICRLGVSPKEFDFLFDLNYRLGKQLIRQRQALDDLHGHLGRVKKFYMYKCKKAALFAEWQACKTKRQRRKFQDIEPQILKNRSLTSTADMI